MSEVVEPRCAMGFLCRGSTVVAGRRRAALVFEAKMCEECQHWVKTSLRSLPRDWCKLKLTIGESRAPIGDKTRRPRPGPKVPLNVNADALMRELVAVCYRARLIVGEQLNANPKAPALPRNWSPSSQQDYRVLRGAVALVSPHIDKLIADDEGLKLAQRMIQVHRNAKRHLGETEQREKQHLPCPFCGGVVVKEVHDMRGQAWVNGSETPEVIRCTECDGGPNRDGTWSESDYTWLSTMVREREADMLKWLLAEAQWERDVNAWLAAERHWALGKIAHVMYGGTFGADALLEQVQRSAAVSA